MKFISKHEDITDDELLKIAPELPEAGSSDDVCNRVSIAINKHVGTMILTEDPRTFTNGILRRCDALMQTRERLSA